MKLKKPRLPKDQKYPLVLPALLTLDRRACAEFMFHPTRKWRADFCLPTYRILVEIEGGIFSGGRHTRGAGFAGDMEKYNEACKMGYCVMRYQPKDCLAARLGAMLEDIQTAITHRGLYP